MFLDHWKDLYLGVNLGRHEMLAGLAPTLVDVVFELIESLRAAVGASPYTVRIVGTPEETALLNASDVVDAFRELVPPDSSWRK